MNSFRRRVALLSLAALLFCCGFALVGCQGDAPDAPVTPEGAKVATVELEASPSSGYAWSYALSAEGVVEVTRDEYVADEHEGNVDGGGGTQFYDFSPVSDGIVAVRFDYAPAYGAEDPYVFSELHVFVVADGGISEVTDGAEIDELAYGQEGVSPAEVFDYRAERDGDVCDVTVAYDNLDWSNSEEVLDSAFMEGLGRIVAACDVAQWNGFDERDDDILDGSSFSLDVTLADGSTIRARGYNAWPENYDVFLGMLRLLFEPYDIPSDEL